MKLIIETGTGSGEFRDTISFDDFGTDDEMHIVITKEKEMAFTQMSKENFKGLIRAFQLTN